MEDCPMSTVADLKDSILALNQDDRNELLNWVADEFETVEDHDPELLALLERRSDDLLSGRVKGITPEELFRRMDADREARR
jgi:putative addiction module component (TIGR02574 family)